MTMSIRAAVAAATLAVAVLGPSMPPAAHAATAAPATAAADSAAIARAIAAADQFQAKYDYENALTTCRDATAAYPAAFELWWRLARAQTDRGARAQFDGNKDRAEIAFDHAVDAGRRAVMLAPDRPEGHLELAVALGRLALFQGGKEKIRLSKEVKAEADRALAIDPKQDRAHHVLGRWNRGVAQLSFLERGIANVVYGGVPEGATMDAAVSHFEKAIALAPDYANHHLELGRTYLDLGLKAKAKAEFEKVLACPVQTPFDSEYKHEALKLMAKAK